MGGSTTPDREPTLCEGLGLQDTVRVGLGRLLRLGSSKQALPLAWAARLWWLPETRSNIVYRYISIYVIVYLNKVSIICFYVVL